MVCNNDIKNYPHIADRAWRHFKYTKNGVILWLKKNCLFSTQTRISVLSCTNWRFGPNKVHFTHYQIQITHISHGVRDILLLSLGVQW